MGIASYSIEYRNGGSAGVDGRSLGSTGNYKYWSRITVTTDSAGCSKLKISMTTACYNGATNTAYAAGAQAIVSTSPENSVYTGTAANLAASHPANNTTWLFGGEISYDMLPNTTYYIFVLPVWTASNSFTTTTSSFTVTSLADFAGGIRIDNGSDYDMYLPYIDTGSAWELLTPHIDDGSSWHSLA